MIVKYSSNFRTVIFPLCLMWLWHSVHCDSECEDKLTYCDKIAFHCDNNDLEDFMLNNCMETCKKCPKDTDPQGLCKDKGGCDHECKVKNKNTKICSCYIGYELKADGKTCKDIDECAIIKNSCPPGTHCRNVAGGRICDKIRCDSKMNQRAYMGRAECCEKLTGDADCGVVSERFMRIVGGNNSYLGQWPWQVFINIDGSVLCGGTLLNDRWVVTAGHCFKGYDKSQTKIELYFGVRELNKLRRHNVQKSSIKRHIMYPGWKESKFEINDIALIELETPVVYTKYVRPVCLPNGEKPNVGTKCFATGWGLTHEDNEKPSTILQYVDLPIVDPGKCTRAYEKQETKVNSTIMICAGYDEGGKDACRGDSGGPLVCQRCDSCGWYLAGVVSFGRGCAAKGFYGVYADVHYFEEWISSETSIHVSKDKKCTGPYFTQWSEWTQCTVSCGRGGKHTRTRRCIDKGRTSFECEGQISETEECPLRLCPRFGSFGDWSTCSKTCESGVKSRIRECIYGKIGQDGCLAEEATEIAECNKQKCPTWGNWTQWTACSVTCGTGKQKRSRQCENGSDCVGSDTEERGCNEAPCPKWANWSEWETCSVTCGGGIQTSTRTCNGKSCSGKNSREQACNRKKCPVFGDWTGWQPCDATCGTGERYRTRLCKNGNVGDAGCEEGKQLEKETCQVKKCPRFSTWSEWTKCSVTCGVGTQKATRVCEFGKINEEGCVGSHSKSQSCTEKECFGKFTKWSSWTTCSKTCGDGIQNRTRVCEDGRKCVGKTEDARSCKQKECPEFGKWGDWKKCSSTCGGGTQMRTRECLHALGPKDCDGDAEEKRDCNNEKCPGEWTYWSAWTKCDVICGNGKSKRERRCRGAVIGESGCDDGIGEEERECVEEACLSKWGEWESWSPCSKTCDRGLKTRIRACDGGEIGEGGCVPASSQTEKKNCAEVNCYQCFNADFNYCNFYFSTDEACKQNREYGKLYCPVSCSFCPGLHENWETWGECSSTCGSGRRERKRECMNEVAGCEGKATETEICEGSCRSFSSWTEWSACSTTCGDGTRSRERACPFSKCQKDETGSEALTEEEKCNEKPCPGVWQEWTNWGSCSITCGANGIESRKRNCTGGEQGDPGCKGRNVQSRPCSNLKSCPSKWTVWSNWSDCSVTCGEGTQEKSRNCTDGVIGNPECLGKNVMKRKCEVETCPEKWGEWSAWTECNADCVRSKTRICEGGESGESECTGSAEYSEECDASSCEKASVQCEILVDLDLRCLQLNPKNCRIPSVETSCPRTCCEVLQELPCEDDEQWLNYCAFTDYCNENDYVAIFRPYCPKSCGFCTP